MKKLKNIIQTSGFEKSKMWEEENLCARAGNVIFQMFQVELSY